MKNKPEQGFTLLEVLASLTIISIITLVFFNALGFTSLNIKNSDQKAEAIRIAEEVLNKTLQGTEIEQRDGILVHFCEIGMRCDFDEDSSKYVFVEGIMVQGGKKKLVMVAVKWRE